jgi:hypothetical protein
MTLTKCVTTALVAAGLAFSGPAFASNMQGGTGNTGNYKTNNPAMLQKDMKRHTTSKHRMAWCSTKRTHNCRHHKMM